MSTPTDSPPPPVAPPAPPNLANRLGLDYRALAGTFGYREPIIDVHTHIQNLEAAEAFFKVADLFGIDKVWSMNNVEQIDAMRDRFGDRINFIAVPNYEKRDDAQTFGADWLRRIEWFAQKGVRVCKFWAAPRGRDIHPDLKLDSPIRREAMKLARSFGMMFMTHVADPDTWFVGKYADAKKYGTKRQQYDSLRRLLDEYHDVKWIGAHMGGWPEDLDFLQSLLDEYPNYYVDTSATKWMVRELSKTPDAFAAFCKRNVGRVLFGSDIVATADNVDFDLFASRYWALRTLLETDHVGESPIADPDLVMLDPSLPVDAAPMLRGAKVGGDVLRSIYRDAAVKVMR